MKRDIIKAVNEYLLNGKPATIYYCDNGIKKLTLRDNSKSFPVYYSFTIQSLIRSGRIEKPFFYTSQFTGSHNKFDILNELVK